MGSAAAGPEFLRGMGASFVTRNAEQQSSGRAVLIRSESPVCRLGAGEK